MGKLTIHMNLTLLKNVIKLMKNGMIKNLSIYILQIDKVYIGNKFTYFSNDTIS